MGGVVTIFHAPEINYLGVILGKKGTRMDPAKVAGVRDWPTPTCVKDVRSFHGFCNFYHTFIAGFSKIALPSMPLPRKGCRLVGPLWPRRHSIC